MDIWLIIIALIVGLVTGAINTLAGGGSLVTLPLLIFMGLPPTVANGTNRVSIVAHTLVATVAMRKKISYGWRKVMWLLVPSIAGAITGAVVAVELDEDLVHTIIGIAMLVMLVPILSNSKKWLRDEGEIPELGNKFMLIIIFYIIGFYGGFLQAGVGLFLLIALVLIANHPVVQANALKNLIVLCYSIPALAIFAWNGQVHWGFGGLMAVGQAVGAYFGARYAMGNSRVGQLTRILLIIMIVGSLLKMFVFG